MYGFRNKRRPKSVFLATLSLSLRVSYFVYISSRSLEQRVEQAKKETAVTQAPEIRIQHQQREGVCKYFGTRFTFASTHRCMFNTSNAYTTTVPTNSS